MRKKEALLESESPKRPYDKKVRSLREVETSSKGKGGGSHGKAEMCQREASPPSEKSRDKHAPRLPEAQNGTTAKTPPKNEGEIGKEVPSQMKGNRRLFC